MTCQTLTLQVPDVLYTRLKERARQANRSVEAELLDVLATAVPPTEELPGDLAEAVAPLALLDDAALWQAARSRLPDQSASRLEDLHLKRQREGLTDAEGRELAALVVQYERTVLVRARAAALLRERGHDIASLPGSR
jgi:plasmid stability protein